ncbi:unnamed protein product [Effrenium voratum]|uniref:Uncharacterized protein n=1 Tax=Effrenium voratum TaxID=2562239 RepID=A0AA36MU34_9DINO|nr:unnamed protein product [Effrenium voratum]
MSDRDSAESRVLLLRASRAARVGARAGRLTRVLRVCRCFLDFGDIDEPAKRPPTKKAGFDSLREEARERDTFLNMPCPLGGSITCPCVSLRGATKQPAHARVNRHSLRCHIVCWVGNDTLIASVTLLQHLEIACSCFHRCHCPTRISQLERKALRCSAANTQ